MSNESRAGGGAWWRRKRPAGDGAGEPIAAHNGAGLWAVGDVIADLYEVKAVCTGRAPWAWCTGSGTAAGTPTWR